MSCVPTYSREIIRFPMTRAALIVTTFAIGHTLAADTLPPVEALAAIAAGQKLTVSEAASLEQKIAADPSDFEARIKVLAYDSLSADGNIDTRKASRARHILWIVQNEPEKQIGLAQLQTGIQRVNCKGDPLADPDLYRRVADLWVAAVDANPASLPVRYSALQALSTCEPENAREFLVKANDRFGLGRLCALAALGVSAVDYKTGLPDATEPALRETAFAKSAVQELENSSDPVLIRAAAEVLLNQGADLWTAGKLDWDYTDFGKRLLAKAKQAVPDDVALAALSTELPKRGEALRRTLRIGGAVQQAHLVRQVAPAYPKGAKAARIQGTVKFGALIGIDGSISRLQVLSGPPLLINAALEAVKQWQYKPILLSGKPAQVITTIEVNFHLQ
jgi:TonB family protein